MGRHLGKQIAVGMSASDERSFLSFVRSTGDVQLLVTPSATKEGLFVSDLPAKDKRKARVFLWNRRFQWEPKVVETTQGGYHISDIGTAPVVEYARHPLRITSLDRGRLYWAQGITPNGPFTYRGYPYSYDAAPVHEWYSELCAWVKQQSRAKGTGENATYYLPGAWWRYGWYARY